MIVLAISLGASVAIGWFLRRKLKLPGLPTLPAQRPGDIGTDYTVAQMLAKQKRDEELRRRSYGK